MSISYDTSAKATAAASSTSLSYTVGAGSGALMIIIVVSNTNADTISTAPTYNGVSATFLTSHTIANSEANTIFIYYIPAPTQSSSQTVAASVVSGTGIKLYVVSYLGTAQFLNSNFSSVDAGGSPTSSTRSLTISAGNSWTVSVCGTLGPANNPAVVASTGTTSRQTSTNTIQQNGGTNMLSDSVGDSNGAVGAGSYSMVWTFTSSDVSNQIMFEMPSGGKVSVLETITPTDIATAIRTKIVSVLETITGTDTVTAIRVKVTSVLETITSTDIVSMLFKWTRQSKNSSNESNTSKHTSIWTDTNKDSSSFTNKNKS